MPWVSLGLAHAEGSGFMLRQFGGELVDWRRWLPKEPPPSLPNARLCLKLIHMDAPEMTELPRRALIIGDSFVEGVGAPQGKGWAAWLARKLEPWVCEVAGEGGDNTGDLIARWPTQSYDTYVVQVGTNDSRFRPSLKGPQVPIR